VILVDSNILIDVLGDGQMWRSWSIDQLATIEDGEGAFVNQIAFAEVAARLGSLADFNAKLKTFGIDFRPFDEQSAFEAGRAFITYRRNRGDGAPSLPLPDFFIGAHAFHLGASILTRDPRFYRTYFPSVPLITPDKAET
jgi:predicted nucleic acid-binding protein